MLNTVGFKCTKEQTILKSQSKTVNKNSLEIGRTCLTSIFKWFYGDKFVELIIWFLGFFQGTNQKNILGN